MVEFANPEMQYLHPNMRHLLVRDAGLTPVPFYQDVAAAAVHPAMGYPVGAGPRRLFPSSGSPNVGVAVPTVIPGDPHMGTAGPRTPIFDYDMGWRDADYHIGRRGAKGQHSRKHKAGQSFQTHKSFFSSLLLRLLEGTSVAADETKCASGRLATNVHC